MSGLMFLLSLTLFASAQFMIASRNTPHWTRPTWYALQSFSMAALTIAVGVYLKAILYALCIALCLFLGSLYSWYLGIVRSGSSTKQGDLLIDAIKERHQSELDAQEQTIQALAQKNEQLKRDNAELEKLFSKPKTT